MLKVCKFGGSSLADAKQFSKVKAIIESDEARKVIIVSAPGKSQEEPEKVTDLLIQAYKTKDIKKVKERILSIKKELGLTCNVEEPLNAIEKALEQNIITEQVLVSRGEYFSAMLLADYLGYTFVDSRSLIHFKDDGKVDLERTRKDIALAVKEHERVVIPGFYGSKPDGSICLFSRGGSDVSAAYAADAVSADLYENFTDVSGFYMADPRLIENPHRIKEISHDELRELAYTGAQVLHQETIIPLIEKGITLELLNTNHPEEGSTLIKKYAREGHHLITGFAGRKGLIALTFVKSRESNKLEVIRKILNVLHEHQIPVEHIPTSIDSFSVIIDKSKIEDQLFAVIEECEAIPEIVSITQDDDVALVAIVGQNMAKKPGVSGRLLSVFGEENINIKLIDQGRVEINIIVGVSNDDLEKSIKALYSRFAKELV
ncbi:MAG: aspartate kinase [Bacilli bacterium]|nr:aspartate kinase [Bacilli bacterium]